MLSVVIAADNLEQKLVPTLAALVPGATAALVTRSHHRRCRCERSDC